MKVGCEEVKGWGRLGCMGWVEWTFLGRAR